MNIIYFITHTTLGGYHAQMSIESLFQQDYLLGWDKMYIYNTHPDELPNSQLQKLITEITNGNTFNFEVMSYDDSSPKTLCYDLQNIKDHVLAMPSRPNKVLILKSDYALSRSFNRALIDLPDSNFIWTLPIANAKEFVTKSEIRSYLDQEFRFTDLQTYYRGSDLFEPKHEIGPIIDGQIVMDTDRRICFVSHNVKRDFNCHVISGDIFDKMAFTPEELKMTWGGPYHLFSRLFADGVQFVDNRKAFAVHMFHEIVSKNRDKDREDWRKTILGQRY